MCGLTLHLSYTYHSFSRLCSARSTSPHPQPPLPTDSKSYAVMHTWFMVFIWAWCLPLMLAVTAAEEQQGGGCSAKCGNFTISDPFWLTDWETGRSCGSPGLPDFQLTCFNKNYPVLPSSVPNSPSFRIIDVFYGERSLRVIDLGKMPLLHRASNSFNSCLPIWNTSVILGRSFRISPTNLGLILYNCTEGAAAEARREKELLQATTMRCMNTSNTFVRAGVPYDPTGNYSGYALEGCVATVVPVLRLPSGQTNAGNYERLIDDGFLLTWDLLPSPPGQQPHDLAPPWSRSPIPWVLLNCIFSYYPIHPRYQISLLNSDCCHGSNLAALHPCLTASLPSTRASQVRGDGMRELHHRVPLLARRTHPFPARTLLRLKVEGTSRLSDRLVARLVRAGSVLA
uniref:Wall-associated receptor kinase galacturonan-binding domain-containing protein n=1 Tax=Hordeum vulgare subsp. vulgare TaxID=112509 RepID=A0A8I6WYI5_HORVV